MMIKDNLIRIVATLKPGVRLVAVSKYQPIAALQEAYDAGQRAFGESHVPEFKRLLVAYYEDRDKGEIVEFMRSKCWRTF